MNNIDLNPAVIVVAVVLWTLLIVWLAIADQQRFADRYIDWCIEEGNPKSTCVLRWVDAHRQSGQSYQIPALSE